MMPKIINDGKGNYYEICPTCRSTVPFCNCKIKCESAKK